MAGKWEAYSKEYPELAKEWELWHSDELPVDLLNDEDFGNLMVQMLLVHLQVKLSIA